MCSYMCNLWNRSWLLAEQRSHSDCGIVLAVHHVVETVKVEPHTLLRSVPRYLSTVSRERHPGTPFSGAAHPISQQREQHWTFFTVRPSFSLQVVSIYQSERPSNAATSSMQSDNSYIF